MDRPHDRPTCVVRTYFDDEGAWSELIADVMRAGSIAETVSDISFREAQWDTIAARLPPTRDGVVFIADAQGMRALPHTVLVVDLTGEWPPFRSQASATAEIEMNLVTENLGFEEFSALALSQGGTFRGTLDASAVSEPAGTQRARRVPRRRSPVVPGKARVAAPKRRSQDLHVTVPSSAWSHLVAKQQRLGATVEQLLHDFVLRDVLSDEAEIIATSLETAPLEAPEVSITIQVGMVLGDLMTIGARRGGFTSVEEYCAAALRAISELT